MGLIFPGCPHFLILRNKKQENATKAHKIFFQMGTKVSVGGRGTQNFCDGGVQALMGASPYWTALSVILGAMAVLPPSLPQRAKFRVLDDWLQNRARQKN